MNNLLWGCERNTDEGDRRAAIREHPLEFALDVAVIDPGLAVEPGVDPELRGDDALDPV
jgi:hypothetical protein